MINHTIQQIEALGYTNIIMKSKRSLTVLVDGDRRKVQNEIMGGISDSIKESCSNSSIGRIVTNGIKIYVKPLSARTGISAHSLNEQLMYEQVTDALHQSNGAISVSIEDTYKNTIIIEAVVGCEMCGTDTKNRKKSDINLLLSDGTKYGISLKMDNAAHWESADKYYQKTASIVMAHLIEKGLVTVTTADDGVNKIYPNVVIEASDEEIRDVTFGNDLLGNGCILVRTLEEQDFDFDDEIQHLTIKSTVCADSPQNPYINNNVWFLIRNDSTRRNDNIVPGVTGIRTLAINRNVRSKTQLLVTKEWLDIILDSKRQDP